jgi:hypothetical protein
VARVREGRGVYRVLVGKHEGKRLLGRIRLRWEGYIRWILKKLNRKLWIGLSWLTVGISSRMLCTR